MSLVFVTVICDLYKDHDYSKYPMTPAWSESWLDINFRLNNLKKLIDSNIPLIIFAEPGIIPNDWLMPTSVTIIPFSLAGISTYNEILNKAPQLPNSVNGPKDRLTYFALMNSKLDFIAKASVMYPNIDTFCWIDCGIFKFVKNIDIAYDRLGKFNEIEVPTAFLSPTGLWPMFTNNDRVIDHVWWRFLGSLFFVKAETLPQFKLLCDQLLHDILNSGKVTWEVNIWAMLEFQMPQLFTTYQADHNDSIFDVKLGRTDDAT